MSYTEVLSLAENNLLFVQETESTPVNKQEELQFNFNGQPLKFIARKNQCIINFYKFTPVGAELAQLIADKPNNDYFNELKSVLSHHFEIKG
mgnify:CR=1 FL=1